MSIEKPTHDQVVVSPQDIVKQVPWDQVKGVVILCDMGHGKINQLYLSCPMSLETMAYMSKQLDAHLTYILGPMKEGF